MTNRNPPPGPPGRPQPRFEAYRPADERGNAGRPAHPPQGYGYPPQRSAGPPQRGYGPPPGYPPPQKANVAGYLFYGVLGLMAMAAGAIAFTITMLPAN